MFYDLSACHLGLRDVLAAWLVCLVVAGAGVAYAMVTSDREARDVEVGTACSRAPPFENFSPTRINGGPARS